MSEYIEREAANNALLEAIRVFPSSFYNGIYNGIEVARTIIINRIPAADVRPVVRGEWHTTDAFPHHVYCSVCHKTYIPNDRWQIWVDGDLPRDFCPNCGADMRKEDAQ